MPTITITVQVTDEQATVSRDFTIAINDVEERPSTPQLVGSPAALVSEGVAAGTDIAQFAATDPDGDAVGFRLRSGPPSIFAVNGDRLQFAPGFNGDFETLAGGNYASLPDRDGDGLREIEYNAEVESFDGTLASESAASVSILVEDVNEAPTALALTGAATMPERDRPETGVALPAVPLGLLFASDPDLGESHTSPSPTDASRWWTATRFSPSATARGSIMKALQPTRRDAIRRGVTATDRLG